MIIMDIMMPKMSGIDVAKKLTKYKILFMTAYYDLEIESKKIKNSLGCIRKPLDLKELLEKIKKTL